MDLNAIAVLLTPALIWVGQELAKEGLKPGAAQALKPLTIWLESRDARRKAQDSLQSAFSRAVEAAGIPLEDENKARAYARRGGLEKLQLEPMDALRRQLARAVVGFTDPGANPPEDLLLAFGWQPERADELRRLLVNLRENLAGTEEWAPLVENANTLAQLDLLAGILGKLARLDDLVVLSASGKALRVVIEARGLDAEEESRVEERYRQDLVRILRLHDFRGISQYKQNIRLPLVDIYLDLSLSTAQSEDERLSYRGKIEELPQEERLALERERLEDRITDTLARDQRLVILGDPGAGKTIALKFIALMLAYQSGSSRLGLEAPYIPLRTRLADFAVELEKRPALGLETFLLEYTDQAFRASNPRLGELLRLALENGNCMVLLDGLDELEIELRQGKATRSRVLQAVQTFADL